MVLLVFAALLESEPATISPPRAVFTPEEVVALGDETKRECGYASPQDLLSLANGERQKILPCFVEATVNRSSSFLPKIVEPGATIVSVSNFEGLPIFVLRLAANHPRALVPINEPSDYDQLLSTRTCDDKWLGGLIDAGMMDGTQGGAVIVYKFESEKAEVLAAIAVAQCFHPQ